MPSTFYDISIHNFVQVNFPDQNPSVNIGAIQG
jgi:hypothetical protein